MRPYNPVQIWYASGSRAESSLKFFVYDDKGRVTLHDGIISFQGKHLSFDVADIEDIELASQRPNWPLHLFAASAVFISLILRGGSPICVAPLIACAVILALILGSAVRWVKITYQTDDDLLVSVWFADGGNFGWDGLLGGTRRLFDIVRDRILVADEANQEPVVLGISPLAPGASVERECPWCGESVIPDEYGRCPACDRPT